MVLDEFLRVCREFFRVLEILGIYSVVKVVGKTSRGISINNILEAFPSIN